MLEAVLVVKEYFFSDSKSLASFLQVVLLASSVITGKN
jgi:hypothetical protein